jgi:hypothetical protein
MASHYLRRRPRILSSHAGTEADILSSIASQYLRRRPRILFSHAGTEADM